jgi:SanA protein
MLKNQSDKQESDALKNNTDFKKAIKTISKIIIFSFWIFLLPFSYFQIKSNFINSLNQEKDFQVAIVFGAGIRMNKEPSKILRLRLEEARKMYSRKQIQKIVVTGDNSANNYNEPLVMKNYLIQKGVAESDIITDFGGRRTIDSCYRLKNFFNLKKAYLITQAFHIPRASYLCQKFGMQIKTVEAPKSSQETTIYGILREIPASFLSLYESFNFSPQIKSNGNEADLSMF